MRTTEDKKITKQVLDIFTNLLASGLNKLNNVKVVYAQELNPVMVPDFIVNGKILWFYSSPIASFWTGQVEGQNLKVKAEISVLNKNGNVVKSYQSDEEKSRSTSTDIQNFRAPMEKVVADMLNNISGEIK